MSNITPITPSFTLGYWRPWKQDSKLIDSYLDYLRDTSLVRYGADTIGDYINQASAEQVSAINNLGQTIGRGMNILQRELSEVNDNLTFINRNLDIQIEQQRLSNLLLQDISKLLRVPDSEKERQHSIELGVKFFVNAQKDADLYADALEELTKAESLMKQDYFVLHRIGCIYLYAEKYVDPEKALDYFLKAAKYASVESNPDAARLVNVLINNDSSNKINSKNKKSANNSIDGIKLLAADSYEKAAFAAYIIGKFDEAVIYQQKALDFRPTPQTSFILSKYLARNNKSTQAAEILDKAIDDLPDLVLGVFRELDLANEEAILKLVEQKNNILNEKIDNLIEEWKQTPSKITSEKTIELADLKNKPFDVKVKIYIFLLNELADMKKNHSKIFKDIDNLKDIINNRLFCNLEADQLNKMLIQLEESKTLNYEDLIDIYKDIYKIIDNDIVKIGSIYQGGIVVHLEDDFKHGFVKAVINLNESVWGSRNTLINTGVNESGRYNTTKIIENDATMVNVLFFKKKTPNKSAARICTELVHNGYNDWFLPSVSECKKIYDSYYTYIESQFYNLLDNLEMEEKTKQIIESRNTRIDGWYWSSSEFDSDKGYVCLFSSNFKYETSFKNSEYRFFAIRKF